MIARFLARLVHRMYVRDMDAALAETDRRLRATGRVDVSPLLDVLRIWRRYLAPLGEDHQAVRELEALYARGLSVQSRARAQWTEAQDA